MGPIWCKFREFQHHVGVAFDDRSTHATADRDHQQAAAAMSFIFLLWVNVPELGSGRSTIWLRPGTQLF
jgi:hypothetical protein